MNITWNQQLMKKENKAIVLQLIKNRPTLSRAEIAQLSGLNKGTVSSLVAELLEEQLIIETGPGESNGGRRPVMLKFNEHAGYTIGVDLGVNYILGILTDLNGNILEKIQYPYKEISIDQIIIHLKENIQQLKSKAPNSPYGIVGIGIGAPGIVDKNSALLLAPNLGWKDSTIQQDLENYFKIPVVVENEANAGAYGEKMFGLGKGIKDLVYISTGIGIGTGIIIDGELYRGTSGFSGEFGHMTVNFNGGKCRCGNIGCWELYASEEYFINRALEINLIQPEQANIEDVIRLANQDHAGAINLCHETAKHLAMGIVNIIHALNPNKIIIGNRLSAAKKWMEKQTQNYVNKHVMTFHQKVIDIQFSDPNFPATALGVAAFSSENFIKRMLES